MRAVVPDALAGRVGGLSRRGAHPRGPARPGQPVYFADVVVPRNHRAKTFRDLRGGSWVYNDPGSLSGWHSMRFRLQQLGHEGGPDSFFDEVRVSGSHRESVRQVAAGRADASAIDSNALALQLREDPASDARIRVLETWGPLPIQPFLAARSLDPEVPRAVAEALLAMHQNARLAATIAHFGFAGFARVDPAFYGSFRILDTAF